MSLKPINTFTLRYVFIVFLRKQYIRIFTKVCAIVTVSTWTQSHSDFIFSIATFQLQISIPDSSKVLWLGKRQIFCFPDSSESFYGITEYIKFCGLVFSHVLKLNLRRLWMCQVGADVQWPQLTVGFLSTTCQLTPVYGFLGQVSILHWI